MDITHETFIQLHHKGISNMNDLADFDNDTLKKINKNLRYPGDFIKDPDPGAASGETI